MSGGGGGVIIIRSRLRAAATDSAVQDHVHPSKLPKLTEILAKADGAWTDDETHFVSRRVMEAYDEQC
jgi:hypothetical protein